MPARPTIFSSRPRPPRGRQGGSTALRDRSSAYKKLCERILTEEPLCRYCRSTNRVEAATVIDHIVALSLNGSNDPDNLAPACHDCNSKKATAERSFIAKGYDVRDVMLCPDLCDWITRARLGALVE